MQAFEDQMEYYKLPPSWQKFTDGQRKDIVLKLLDQLDLSKKSLRMKAARTVLYLAQGCFAEVQSDHEQQQWTRNNVKLLYEMGLFATFVELLNYEIEYELKLLQTILFFLHFKIDCDSKRLRRLNSNSDLRTYASDIPHSLSCNIESNE